MFNLINPLLICTFEKSSWKIQVQWTGFLACKNQFRNWFLQATQAVKIQFVELDFFKLIFQKSSTDQQGVRVESAESIYFVFFRYFSSQIFVDDSRIPQNFQSEKQTTSYRHFIYVVGIYYLSRVETRMQGPFCNV